MLTVIIIHYADTEKTIKCINSVKERIKVPYEILIWDNDEKCSKEKFKIKDLKYKVLTLHKNIGYGAAINRAVKFSQYEWILILNNDTEIIEFKMLDLKSNIMYGALTFSKNEDITTSLYLDPNPIDELFKNLRISSIFYRIVCYLGRSKGKGIKDGRKWYGNEAIFSGFNINDVSSGQNKSLASWTYNIGGHFILMKKDIFDKIGGFDENYFMYAEEFDLCKRARLKGYKIIIQTDFKVKHAKEENDKDTNLKFKVMKWRIDSKLYYLNKFYPALFIFTLLSNILTSIIYIIIYIILQKERSNGFINKELKIYYICLLKRLLERL